MATVKIEVDGFQCERCSYEWTHRSPNTSEKQPLPTVCPKCKSPYWNKPRQQVVKKNRRS